MGSTSPDTQSNPAVSGGDPLEDLQGLVGLVGKPERSQRALASLSAEERLLAQEALDRLTQLSAITDWSAEELFRELGCKWERVDDLEDQERRLRSCAEFIGLLGRLAGVATRRADRRMIVIELARTMSQGRPQVAQLEDALAKGDPSPFEYIRLGEIYRAGQALRRSFGLLEAPIDDSRSTFAGEPEIHLSVPRLDLYMHKDVEALSLEVYSYIDLHVAECPECMAEVDRRRKRSELLGKCLDDASVPREGHAELLDPHFGVGQPRR